jgi:hopanoid biosynthesis associated protein HpnK
MQGLIVTVDDFGAAIAVNEAVERGHRDGIVTAASLMVGGAAFADAVDRAQRLPRLGVGLHVVLVDGRPVVSPERIPALVGADGHFHSDMVRTAFALALSPSARAQMRAEIEAQFAAFVAAGLRLDHVNAHKHFHLHPMIASALLAIGPRYGMRAMRVPLESATPWAMRRWSRHLAERLRRAGLLVNDEVRGLRWSGAFDAARMQQALGELPDGLTELYCHAASADSYPGSAAGYRYREELAALLDPGVRKALASSGTRHGCFADFATAPAG